MGILLNIIAFLSLVGGIALAVFSLFWPTATKQVSERDEAGEVKRDRYGNIQYKDVKYRMPGRVPAAALGIVLVVFGLFGMGIRIVEPGNTGVVVTAGNVQSEERAPGITWAMPFVDDIISFPTRVVAWKFEKTAAASKEYQDVFLTGVVNYHIDPNGAAELYTKVGPDYESKLVAPFFNSLVKEIVPRYGVAEVLPQRDQIRSETVTALAAKLAPYGLIVDDVALSNVDFNEEYNQAIQQKQIEELKVQTERNILQQKQVQAQQAQAEAKGKADANIEIAKGDAEALLLKRQAEAEGNRAVAASLTEAILRQRSIDKFNPNVNVVLMPAESGDFIFPQEFLSPTPAP